jgi:transforming growth factor-beta-induced protein
MKLIFKALPFTAILVAACGGSPSTPAASAEPAPMSEPQTAAAAPGNDMAPTAQKDATPAAKSDIVDTAIAAGSFTTLVAAVKAAGLVDTLKGPGPFTVFAPTDDAFKKLPPGTVEMLLKPENESKLVDLLKFHVVSGHVSSKDAMGVSSAKSLLGKDLKITPMNGGLSVGGGMVIKADIECSNGVIHVVDTVLMPK